jgi:hypothetical protein
MPRVFDPETGTVTQVQSPDDHLNRSRSVPPATGHTHKSHAVSGSYPGPDMPPCPAPRYNTLGINESHRAGILHEAMQVTSGEREGSYGSPRQNFDNIATLWTAHLSARFGVHIDLTAEDVAWMMSDVKRARAMHSTGHRDNYVDGACYVAIAGELRESAEADKERG